MADGPLTGDPQIVEVSNWDKVLLPEDVITKGGLIS